MRALSIDITDIAASSHPDDYVLISAPRVRGSSTRAGGVVSTAPRRVSLVAGKATVNVEPGPLFVQLRVRALRDTAPFEVVVPSGTGTITLRSCMENKFRYTPAVESAIAAAASAAASSERAALQAQNKSEAAAKKATDRVDEAIRGGAELVRAEVQANADRASAAASNAETLKAAAAASAASAAQAASTTAGEIRRAVSEAASAAAVSASKAEEQATKAVETATSTANLVRSEAQASLTAASQAATNAEASAATAQQAAKNAGSVAASAMAYVRQTETNWQGSMYQASQAGFRRNEAETFSAQAERSATAAAASMRDAAEAKNAAVAAANNAKIGAPAAGWGRESLTAQVRESLDRADRALTAVPRATNTESGSVKLAGDLSGTWDRPTVPGLANKMDKTDVSDGLAASAIARRTSRGTLVAAPGTGPSELVTVDQLDKKTVSLGSVEGIPQGITTASVNSSPNTIPVRNSQGGLVVTDTGQSSCAVSKGHMDTALAEKVNVRDAIPDVAEGKVVRRAARGNIYVPNTSDASSDTVAASKGYVDSGGINKAHHNDKFISAVRKSCVVTLTTRTTHTSGGVSRADVLAFKLPEWARPATYIQFSPVNTTGEFFINQEGEITHANVPDRDVKFTVTYVAK